MKLWKRLFPNHRPAHPYCSAVIAAAGSSQRMEGENKLLLPLGGKPVLAHTLQAIDRAPSIREIIIAAREEDMVRFAELCKAWGIEKPVKVVLGGKTREESVLRAAMETNEEADLIAVQDGARPLVTPELIERVIEAARVNLPPRPPSRSRTRSRSPWTGSCARRRSARRSSRCRRRRCSTRSSCARRCSPPWKRA